jgi:hypothetical protein
MADHAKETAGEGVDTPQTWKANGLVIRRRIWLLFDDPSSSAAVRQRRRPNPSYAGMFYHLQAQALSIIIMFLIALSCTTFVLETLPYFQENPTDVWCEG